MSAPRIAIIGAGMTGLTCARALAGAGLAPTLFEKARGPGGRITTRRREGAAFDHGVPSFRAAPGPFFKQARKWEQDGVLAPWSPRRVFVDDAGAPHELASEARWVGAPRMSAIGRHLADGLELSLQTRIERLVYERAADPWKLVQGDGRTHAGFRALVVTAPPVQTRALLESASKTAGRFAALESARMTPRWCLLVRFDEAPALDFDEAMFEDDVLASVIVNDSKPERGPEPCWVVHATDAWSTAHEDDDAEDVRLALHDALARRLPGLPSIADTDTHRWRYAIAGGTPPGVLAAPDIALWCGGDWSHGEDLAAAHAAGQGLAAAVRESVR